FAIAVDPANSSTVYATSGPVGSGNLLGPAFSSPVFVYRSDDGGASWKPASSGLSFHVFDLAFDRTGVLYASTNGGVFKTANSGASWTASGNAGLPEASTNVVVPDPTTPGVLYVGLEDFGTYRSSDGGATWAASEGGLTGLSTLAVVPSNGQVFALGGGGSATSVFRSDDHGAHWAQENSGLEGVFTFSLATDPENSSVVYAGTESLGVYKSTDAGAHWSFLSTTFAGDGVDALAVNPSNSSVLLAGFQDSTYRSTDGGGHWSDVCPVAAYHLVFSQSDPEMVFMFGENPGTGNSEAAWSTDGGLHWTREDKGLPPAFFYDVNSLAIDPDSPLTLYVAIKGQLYMTRDFGSLWSPVVTPFSDSHVTAIAVNPLTGLEIIVAADGSGSAAGHLLFESLDGGSSWAPFDDGLTSFCQVTSLAFEPDGLHLHAGTIGESVFDVQLPPPPLPRLVRAINPASPAKNLHGRG
ncbi:MAG: WD40/YVTN/BNR-like repeat-containing protein, partial [Fimbriimonadales bacterium]